MHYFSFDPEPVDELILATTNSDLIPLVRRVKRTRNARVRMWGSDDVLEGTEFADQVIFQPLETLLGIQQTKNVAIYIDFENIAISLNEQGYIVNLDTLIESFVPAGQGARAGRQDGGLCPLGAARQSAAAGRPVGARNRRRSAQPLDDGEHRSGVQSAGQEQRRHAHGEGHHHRLRARRRGGRLHRRQRRPRLQGRDQRAALAQQDRDHLVGAWQHQPPAGEQPEPHHRVHRRLHQPANAPVAEPGVDGVQRRRLDWRLHAVAVVERDHPVRPLRAAVRQRDAHAPAVDRPVDRRRGGGVAGARRRPRFAGDFAGHPAPDERQGSRRARLQSSGRRKNLPDPRPHRHARASTRSTCAAGSTSITASCSRGWRWIGNWNAPV